MVFTLQPIRLEIKTTGNIDRNRGICFSQSELLDITVANNYYNDTGIKNFDADVMVLVIECLMCIQRSCTGTLKTIPQTKS